MLRHTAFPRRVLGLVLAIFIGTGIGIALAVAGLGSASGADTPQTLRAGTTAIAPVTGAAPAPGEAPPSSPLTLDEATAVAAQVAPGRVVEWDTDDEPTGLRYDVTLVHDDGSTTEVEVDTITGQVTSINHDSDLD